MTAQGAQCFWVRPCPSALSSHQTSPWRAGPAGNGAWPAAPVKDTGLTHLAPEPLRLSSGTAPTAHRRSRLVLLPLTSRKPEHSSTPRRPEVA